MQQFAGDGCRSFVHNKTIPLIIRLRPYFERGLVAAPPETMSRFVHKRDLAFVAFGSLRKRCAFLALESFQRLQYHGERSWPLSDSHRGIQRFADAPSTAGARNGFSVSLYFCRCVRCVGFEGGAGYACGLSRCAFAAQRLEGYL